jgi:hypothetical protein
MDGFTDTHLTLCNTLEARLYDALRFEALFVVRQRQLDTRPRHIPASVIPVVWHNDAQNEKRNISQRVLFVPHYPTIGRKRTFKRGDVSPLMHSPADLAQLKMHAYKTPGFLGARDATEKDCLPCWENAWLPGYKVPITPAPTVAETHSVTLASGERVQSTVTRTQPATQRIAAAVTLQLEHVRPEHIGPANARNVKDTAYRANNGMTSRTMKASRVAELLARVKEQL